MADDGITETRNLSDILGDIHVRAAHWTRVELNGDVGIWLPKGKQLTVHFVLGGNPLMSVKSRSKFPLRAGDAMIVLDRQPHVIMNEEGAHIATFPATRSKSMFDDISTCRFENEPTGAPRTSSAMLTGIFRVRWPPELSQWWLLPPLLHGNRNFRTEAAGRESVSVFESLVSRPGGTLCITRYVEFLLARELQQVLERSPGLLRTSSRTSIAVENALAAIAQDPARSWSVATLARHVGMSRSIFAERFIKFAGVSPMALVFQHRMELSVQYLKQGNLPVKEIAELIGYRSVASFTRAFSSHFNISPAAYRKAAHGNSSE